MQQRWRRASGRIVMGVLLALCLVSAAAAERTLLVMGDSLSAAYQLRSEQSWVALLEQRLRERASSWRVVNASVSGETTAGGASRLASELRRNAPDVVVIELGANDGLRGLPLAQARDNLQRMIEASRRAGARVLLIGMRLPPNYGSDYTDAFAAMYTGLARDNDVALLPFLLEPIASDADAFLADNLHPNADSQQRLLEHVWTGLEPLLEEP